MKQIQACPISLTIVISLVTGFLFPHFATAARCEEWVAKVVSVQGNVQVQEAGETQWEPVISGKTYCSGDTIRTQERSRAVITLGNTSPILYFDQQTMVILLGLYWLYQAIGKIYIHSPFPISKLPTTPPPVDRISTSIPVPDEQNLKRLIAPFENKPGLKMITPDLLLSQEDTEFLVEVEEDKTDITVFEGQVRGSNQPGVFFEINSCERAIVEAEQPPRFLPVTVCSRDAVQWAIYYPPVLDYQPDDFQGGAETDWQGMIRESITFYRKGNLSRAFDSIAKAHEEDIHDPRFFTYRAVLLLSAGRVDEARGDIERAFVLDPRNSHALALQSIIAVVQNKNKEGLDLANEAIKGDPDSASAWVALSYAQQANFELEGALASLREAVERDPQNALAWARLAELWLSFGDLDNALEAAKKAEELNTDLARTQTVLGFAYLTQIKTRESKKAFERAIQLDQADPLPRLGLGLAKIREGDLEEGRRQIELAASLDPANSLVRSYLGKAYYEEKHDKLAKKQLDIAKELDPFDPTPWFYDAIRKQTVNRPIEALQDLEKSIELNNNRAVYRSSLLLDEDLAARSASLARIYSDLGFQQLALVEGWKSLNIDPGNYSAHRFLADSYAVLPRHEIARVSELLQSQLLQPLNITPLQPQIAESRLSIVSGAGPARPSFNEFNPLFNRNRFSLQANGIVGGNDTLGNDLVLFGVQGKISYSLGQFHYETDGFRENSDLEQDLYNVFTQVRLSHKTSLQTELRFMDSKNGDLELRFDPDNFSTDFREKEKIKTFRMGFHHAFARHSDIIGSIIVQRNKLEITEDIAVIEDEANSYISEIQHLFRPRSEYFNIISGVGYFNANANEIFKEQGIVLSQEEVDRRHLNAYIYSCINYPGNFTWTIGASADSFKEFIDRDQINPKIGLSWNVAPDIIDTTLRMAAFRALTRMLVNDQTLEPTQVSGFNQFFDDDHGTDSWHYGIAIDHQFSSGLYGGVEFSKRDLEVPIQIIPILPEEVPIEILEDDQTPKHEKFDWGERLSRAYFYWTPYSWLAASVEWQYEQFERLFSPDVVVFDTLRHLKTYRVPFGISFHHPSGFIGRFKATYIDQEGAFIDYSTGGDAVPGNDQFWLIDATIGYRLSKRLGLITIGARNLFNKKFKYQEMDPDKSLLYPERFIFARFTLAF